jgi:predicted flavoprotein YhiN
MMITRLLAVLALVLRVSTVRGSRSLYTASRPSRARAAVRLHGAFTEHDVVVVGGGASGMFSAVTAARAGASVLVLESGSQPLRKVRISGGGRCNVMHDQSTWDPKGGRELLKQRYPRGASELLGSLTKRFSPVETASWFEAEGVELKCEADGRVFPVTDDSATVIDALMGAASAAGIELMLGAKVVAAERVPAVGEAADPTSAQSGSYIVRSQRRGHHDLLEIRCRALILATGSASHELAAELGHDIAALRPSLFSFRLRKGAMIDGSLAGVSVQDAALTLRPPPPAPAPSAPGDAPKKRRQRRRSTAGVCSRGPLLVTHRGLSGPAALKLSSFAALELGTRSVAHSRRTHPSHARCR